MINPKIPSDLEQLSPKIKVIGVGGAGGNAVNNMIDSNLQGVEFIACNTDAQALRAARAPNLIQLGPMITRGLGAGGKQEVGRAAAEESLPELLSYLEGTNMVFITAGMGGGTGTGAAPVIARAAREQGILTVGVVTKPFHFEGSVRMRQADEGIRELQQYVDTLIVIPNQNLFRVAKEDTTFANAFKMADEVLHGGVRGVTDVIVLPGIVNRDFNDVKTIMSEMGKAMLGTGEAEGPGRALKAAEAAISNPLLDDTSMKGARGVLICVSGGTDITLYEMDEVTNRIRDEVDSDANIIWGTYLDASIEGKIRVSLIATGIDSDSMVKRPPETSGLKVVVNNASAMPSAPAYGHTAPAAANVSGLAPAAAAPQNAFSFGQNNAPTQPAAYAATASAQTTPAAGYSQSAYGGSGAHAVATAQAAAQQATAQYNATARSQNNFTATANATPVVTPTAAPNYASFGLTPAAQAPTMAASPIASNAPSIGRGYATPQTVGNAALQMAPVAEFDETPQQPPSPWNMVPAHNTPSAPASEPVVTRRLATGPRPSGLAATGLVGRVDDTAPDSALDNGLFDDENTARVKPTAPVAKKRGPSLFERVTGIAGRSTEQAVAAPTAPAANRAAAPTPTTAPAQPAAPSAGEQYNAQASFAPNLAPPRAAAPAPLQPATTTSQIQGGPKLSSADEDLLDIPAFLRRQSN